MNVRVRLFAAARRAAGRDAVDVELPEAASIAQLRRRLALEIPQVSDLLRRAMFAIDTEYAADGDSFYPGADVAFIPPVSGG